MLLVSPPAPSAARSPSPVGGRAMLGRVNEAALVDLMGDRLVRFHPEKWRPPTAADIARGYIDGIDAQTIDAIDAMMGQEDIDQLFLDGSNLGAVAREIRRRHPEARIITFLHNVETRFFLNALRARPTLRALAVLAANYVAERAAVRASDTLICLTERDSTGLRRLYGRGADAILPLALLDQPLATGPDTAPPEPFALFVGGGFYGNIEGIRWYAREVAPAIAIQTVIAGRGLDALAGSLAGIPNIRIIGAIDDLAPLYRDAHVVVAPILSGSGMKTKVAEALMHGKRVIGTPEAFAGYDEDVVRTGWLCRTPADFTAAISEAFALPLPPCDATIRSLYESRYSFAAARSRLATVLSRSSITAA